MAPESSEPFVTFSIVCNKATEEWGEIFEKLQKREGHFETT